VLLASARAGNVIGGGDWANDRLIPDIIKASAKNEPVVIRNPLAIRPWQHVLEPLSGYLLLGQLLLEGKKEIADGWNFGPEKNEILKVEEVLIKMKEVWPNLHYTIQHDANQPHEANHLRLDCSKANSLLGWYPVWDTDTAIIKTATWFRAYYDNNILLTVNDLEDYVSEAKEKNLPWA
jgi:CDP-glucose 4,6-dehydratase